VTWESDGKIRRYNLGSMGLNDATTTPISGVTTMSYAGFDGLVTQESDGNIRRYNFSAAGAVSGVASPVAAISTIPYSGFAGIVTRESDGDVRRYAFRIGRQPGLRGLSRLNYSKRLVRRL